MIIVTFISHLHLHSHLLIHFKPCSYKKLKIGDNPPGKLHLEYRKKSRYGYIYYIKHDREYYRVYQRVGMGCNSLKYSSDIPRTYRGHSEDHMRADQAVIV